MNSSSSPQASMSSDLRKNPNRYSFPFDSLPDEIQSRILALLPITTLVLCKAVSRAWRSLIGSPTFTDSYQPSRDPIFLLYSSSRRHPALSARAYLPFTDTWIHFHFPQPVPSNATAGTSLLAIFLRKHLYILDPFSPSHPLHFLPPAYELHHRRSVLVLIQDNPSHYILVAFSIINRIYSTRTYDSRSGQWEEHARLWNGGGFSQLGNAAYLDGLLFCLSSDPNRVLTFDPVGGHLGMLDLDFPVPLFRSHLLSFEGKLYLTGFSQEDMVITRIGIWELDLSAMTWKEFGFMPDKYLTEFSSRRDRSLSMVDCRGVICFSSQDPKEIVFCDLTVRRWWCPRPCNIPGERGFPIGCAIEPHINLLK